MDAADSQWVSALRPASCRELCAWRDFAQLPTTIDRARFTAMTADLKKMALLSTGEVARACGVSTQTIVNWIRQGRLRAATTGGGRFRVHADSLIEFMKAGGFAIPPDLKPGPRLVYVIDDDAAWLAAAKRHLSTVGDVETFPDGYRGLVAVAARPPAVLVLDMKMPGLDGAGVIAALRADEATKELPIVVATSYEEEAAVARRYGATTAVVKGNAGMLRESVAALLTA